MQRNIKATRTVAQWDRRYSVKRPIWSLDPSLELIKSVSPLVPGRALDLGAGEGRNAIWLAEQGWHVTAIDFSAVAIAKAGEFAAEANVSGRVQFEVADLTSIRPTKSIYDLVCLVYLHLPWDSMQDVVRSAVDALRPGGTFVLLGHDETNIENGYGGPQDPDILYGPRRIVQAAGEQLEVIDASRIKRTVEKTVGTRVAIDCFVHGVHL